MIFNRFPLLHLKKFHLSFWKKNPALYFSIYALTGTCAAYFSFLPLIIPLFSLKFASTKFWTSGVIIFCAFYLSANFSINSPSIPPEGIYGSGIISVKQIFNQDSFSTQFKGDLVNFSEDLPPTPISFYTRKKGFENHSHLFIEGKLLNNHYFSPTKIKGIHKSTFSLPWIRYQTKDWLYRHFFKNTAHPKIFAALLLGYPLPKRIQHQLNRFGLQHLFAISGFHFGLIATLLAFCFRPLISYKYLPQILLFFLLLYALLIGPSASVLRAFITLCIVFIAKILGKESAPLNTIGIALICVILFDPLYVQSIGFIFSFAITFSILLFYPLLKDILYSPFALLLSVELTAIPLTLYLFQSFPLLSLIYNLIHPFLISTALFLFPFPYLSIISDKLIDIALFTFSLPQKCDLYLQVPPISPLIISTYLTAIYSMGIFYRTQKENTPLLLQLI
ncbi:ComEC/Rec2 family competence protein [Chlamydiales bacterium]|nr:ComEC/Rec2 family competence protein [Chlamydiales bacterium]